MDVIRYHHYFERDTGNVTQVQDAKRIHRTLCFRSFVRRHHALVQFDLFGMFQMHYSEGFDCDENDKSTGDV